MVIVPRSFSIVVAADIADGIGQNGVLPWHLPKDMAYFKQITTAAPKGMKNGVILGRTTWESLPERFRPLPKRHNIVLSRSGIPFEGAGTARSLEMALSKIAQVPDIYRVFVIGGQEVFKTAILQHRLECIYLTRVISHFDCDTFFPAIPENFHCVQRSSEFLDGKIRIQFESWKRH